MTSLDTEVNFTTRAILSLISGATGVIPGGLIGRIRIVPVIAALSGVVVGWILALPSSISLNIPFSFVGVFFVFLGATVGAIFGIAFDKIIEDQR